MTSYTYTAQHEDASGKTAEKDTDCARPIDEVIGAVVYTMKEKEMRASMRTAPKRQVPFVAMTACVYCSDGLFDSMISWS